LYPFLFASYIYLYLDSQSQIENVKLLSGGERSFATLSLLISLGESVECPFRVIDEFDVFMDVVSRKVCV